MVVYPIIVGLLTTAGESFIAGPLLHNHIAPCTIPIYGVDGGLVPSPTPCFVRVVLRGQVVDNESACLYLVVSDICIGLGAGGLEPGPCSGQVC